MPQESHSVCLHPHDSLDVSLTSEGDQQQFPSLLDWHVICVVPVHPRAALKVGVTVHCCLQSKAPKYLTDCCAPVSEIASRCHLHSASQHHLSVPRYLLTTFGCRAFSVADPTVWNSLPDSLRDLALSSSSFRQLLNTSSSTVTQHTRRSRDAA